MERSRHGKKSKEKPKRTSKKRKSRDENGSSGHSVALSNSLKPLVEYSDVSSEDLSGPEAGEIQSGIESTFSYSDDGELSPNSMHRSVRYGRSSLVEDEYYMSRMISPARRSHRLDPAMIPRSPSPVMPRRERKHSASSKSSISSDRRHRRKVESPPPLPPEYRPIETFEPEEYDRKKRKKKEKKHKKDKKLKKKKRKSKHRSHSSSSLESVATPVEATSPKTFPKVLVREEALSDWEQNQEPPIKPEDVAKIDTTACSPVSNDSHIASPEPEEHLRTPSPRVTPSIRESPHTPPLKRTTNHASPIEVIDVLDAESSISPTPLEIPSRSISRTSYSPPKTSPHRIVSPEAVPHSYTRGSSSPRRRRAEREMSHHRRHRKEKERLKERRRLSRSRSPARRRISRSPSWGRKRYSRSPSRNKTNKRYRSRSPKNPREKEHSSSRTPAKKERIRSPSPHSIRSSQLQNKITDTSLFAELVKDKHKRELELKKLLEKKNDVKAVEEEKRASKDQVDCTVIQVPMDIDDIPIPEGSAIKANEAPPICAPISDASIPLPSVGAAVTPPVCDVAKVAIAPPLPVQPPVALVETTAGKVAPVAAAAAAAVAAPVATASKAKAITKLPMPPGDIFKARFDGL